MANHTGTGQGVPEDQFNDGDAQAAAQILGDSAAGGNIADEATSAGKNAPLNLLPIIPIILGLSVCALNILVAARLWRTAYNNNSNLFERANLPTNVFLALVSISFFVGLFLILYAIVLRHFESRNIHETRDGSRQTPAYVKWILAPLLIALPAPAITVWAAQMIEPIAPTPCIALYQEAQNIKNDNPDFRMYGYDRDQIRCAINQSVLRQ